MKRLGGILLVLFLVLNVVAFSILSSTPVKAAAIENTDPGIIETSDIIESIEVETIIEEENTIVEENTNIEESIVVESRQEVKRTSNKEVINEEPIVETPTEEAFVDEIIIETSRDEIIVETPTEIIPEEIPEEHPIETLVPLGSIEEYFYSFLEAIKTGSYQFVAERPADSIWFSNIIDGIPEFVHYVVAYNEYTSHFRNQCRWEAHYTTEGWKVYTLGLTPEYTPEDFANYRVQAYEKCQEIYSAVHNDSYTDYEQAQAYVSYLIKTYGTTQKGLSLGNEVNGPNSATRLKNMPIDTAYSILIDKKGECVGKAAVFDTLMTLEGFTNYGLSVEGHALSYVILDGTAYICDWGNFVGLVPRSELASHQEWKTNFRYGNLDFIENTLL